MSAAGPAEIAGWVGDEPVPAAEVAAELARLRSGPLAERLPAEGTAEGRQLRRWVAHRVLLRRVLEREAEARGLLAGPALAGTAHTGGVDPALLGSALANVLATSPAARAVYASVTAGTTVTEAEVRDHYRRNPERYATTPYRQARDRIAGELRDRRAQTAFGRWLDRRVAELVRRCPGYEHPSDPRQPDATHRH